MARSKTEDSSGDYRKSAEEWEILGELAERLHHFSEAVEAYQSCLRVRFSPKAMKGVLRMFEGQGRVNEMLQCIIRLVAWQYRWYSEVSLTPTLSDLSLNDGFAKPVIGQFSPSLLQTVRKLIENEGAVKIRNIVNATSLPRPVLDLTNGYVERCASFRSNGSDG